MKNELLRMFVLVAVLAAIAIAIFYLESAKPKREVSSSQPASFGDENLFSPYPKAPELAGISGYINAPSNLTIASLRGKVVLVDFWTYTCINCIRTLPYLESWHEKYAKDGLVIIGVHTPEFDFEKKYENVLAAVEKYGIKYAVVQDNDYTTWRAYQNQYWPHKYLIDANGRVRFDHIGEGGYDETEAKIVELLAEAKQGQVALNSTKPSATAVNPYKIGTPEIYFGQNFRRAPLGNAQPLFVGQAFNATLPQHDLIPNLAYLEGEWINGDDGITLASEKGAVELVFT
ncbi:MAG: redoxin domain-containing protein, partial [Candidatus Anstonellaceae archaeon]